MKKIFFLLVTLLFFPFYVQAATLPTLSKLVIEGEEIELKDKVFEYEAVMTRDGYKADIKATAPDGLTVSIKGDTGIQIGSNDITITVTNEEGQTQEYLIKLVKKAQDSVVLSGNNYLSSLTVDGYDFDFDPEVYEYHLKIGSERKLNIHYQTEHSGAVVYINNNFALVNGSVITLTVTAQSGSIREYKIYIETDFVPEKDEVYVKDELDWKTIGFVSVAVILSIGLILLNIPTKKKKNKK